MKGTMVYDSYKPIFYIIHSGSIFTIPEEWRNVFQCRGIQAYSVTQRLFPQTVGTHFHYISQYTFVIHLEAFPAQALNQRSTFVIATYWVIKSHYKKWPQNMIFTECSSALFAMFRYSLESQDAWLHGGNIHVMELPLCQVVWPQFHFWSFWQVVCPPPHFLSFSRTMSWSDTYMLHYWLYQYILWFYVIFWNTQKM